jgi:hypothetical protein
MNYFHIKDGFGIGAMAHDDKGDKREGSWLMVKSWRIIHALDARTATGVVAWGRAQEFCHSPYRFFVLHSTVL